MKKNLSVVTLAIGTMIALTSCNTTTHIEVAKGVNLQDYKTFGWANDSGVKKSGRVDNDIVDNNIKNSIGDELEKRGWQETDMQPDVLLDYNVMVEKTVRRESEPVYSNPYSGYYYNSFRRRLGYYYSPSFFRGYHSYNVPVKEGTLTVNIIDSKTNKLIWQGWAKGDVTSSNVSSREAEADVKSIFRKLNLPR